MTADNSERASNKTAGDCPNVAESAEQNGTVPAPEPNLLPHNRADFPCQFSSVTDRFPANYCWSQPALV